MINDYLRYGGAEGVMNNLASWLISKGHEVYVSVRNGNETIAKPLQVFKEGSKVPTGILDHQIFQLIRFDPIAYFHYKKLITMLKPDIIHCHNISSFGTAPILAARTCNIPCVLTTHDYWIASANKNLITRKGEICLKYNSWSCISKSSNLISSLGKINSLFAPLIRKNISRRIEDFSNVKLVAVSEFQKSILLSSFPESQVSLIQNGIDVDELDSMPNVSPTKNIIFLGGNAIIKGVQDYLKVAKIVGQSNNVVRFWATGESGRISCKSSPVVFVGRVSRFKLLSLLKSSTCLLTPSLWPEPSPLAVMEAMGLGVPVVAYNVGGIPEIVTNNENGFVVNLGDYHTLTERVKFLIENKVKRDEMSIKASELIHQHYTISRMAKQYEELYTKLC